MSVLLPPFPAVLGPRLTNLHLVASLKDLNSQRRALLAPAQRWRREWVKPSGLSSPSTSSFKVAKWVKVSQTEAEEAEDEAATEDALGSMDAMETSTPTPNPSTPAAARTPGIAGAPPAARHPLSNALSAPASPGAGLSSGVATRSPSAQPIPADSAKNAFPLGPTKPSKPSEIPAPASTGDVVSLPNNADVEMES
jgi:hypothetical protein